MNITPFAVSWSDAQIERLRASIASYPWPPAPEAEDGWRYGADEMALRQLCARWVDEYDWLGAQALLNRFPQFRASVGPFDIHFVHIIGEARGRRPLLMTHGWPGSHFEFWKTAEQLAFPSSFGAQTADAFDLVIPSLPGFGYSSKPARPIGQRETARLFNELMIHGLGYPSYRAQGGDWGGLVTSWLGLDYPDAVSAIHLNMIGFQPSGGAINDAERSWKARTSAAMEELGAYFRLQASKPQSIAWLAAGNPVGQAAWILERFHDWSDLRTRSLFEAYSIDELITNIMIYVTTGSFTTGAWYYRGLLAEGGNRLPPGVRCETPTAFANFPGERLYQTPPRSWVDRAYNVQRWSDMPRGGHFAAMEEPDLFIADVRAWGRETDQRV
jgi:microsomal epoxide hydrolase